MRLSHGILLPYQKTQTFKLVYWKSDVKLSRRQLTTTTTGRKKCKKVADDM